MVEDTGNCIKLETASNAGYLGYTVVLRSGQTLEYPQERRYFGWVELHCFTEPITKMFVQNSKDDGWSGKLTITNNYELQQLQCPDYGRHEDGKEKNCFCWPNHDCFLHNGIEVDGNDDPDAIGYSSGGPIKWILFDLKILAVNGCTFRCVTVLPERK